MVIAVYPGSFDPATYGYSSGNACLIANDIFKYMYNLADKDSILTGIASTDTSDT